jgi:hypothetical protein
MADTIPELNRVGVATTHDDVDAPTVGIPHSSSMPQFALRPQGNEMPRVVGVTFVTVDVARGIIFLFVGDAAISLEG